MVNEMLTTSSITINEHAVPTFLYGTAWKEEDTKRCVSEALEAGFRGIDTANQRKHYYEEGVGAALIEAYEKGSVKRADLFLQTKFTHLAGQDQRLPYDPKKNIHTQVMQSFASSLEHLHTDYIDSYVLHGPSSWNKLAKEDWEVWGAMEEIHNNGKVKFLGISNVNLSHLQDLWNGCKVRPTFVQNRCYAKKGWDKDVRAFCNEHEIKYQGFSLLTANTWVFEAPKFREITSRHKCSGAQLIFAFALHVNMIPLTGTTSSAHMKEDLGAYKIMLEANDVDIIGQLA